MPCIWETITVYIPSLPFLAQVAVILWAVGLISATNDWGTELQRTDHESGSLKRLASILRHLEVLSVYTAVFFVAPYLVGALIFWTC